MKELNELSAWTDSIINEFVKPNTAKKQSPIELKRDIKAQAQHKYPSYEPDDALSLFIADKLEDMEKFKQEAEKRDREQNRVITQQGKLIHDQDESESAMIDRINALSKYQEVKANKDAEIEQKLQQIEKAHNLEKEPTDNQQSKNEKMVNDLSARIQAMAEKQNISPEQTQQLTQRVEQLVSNQKADSKMVNDLKATIAGVQTDKVQYDDLISKINAYSADIQQANATAKDALSKYDDVRKKNADLSLRLGVIEPPDEIDDDKTLDFSNLDPLSDEEIRRHRPYDDPYNQSNIYEERRQERDFDKEAKYFENRANWHNFQELDRLGANQAGHGPIYRVPPNWWYIVFIPLLTRIVEQHIGNNRAAQMAFKYFEKNFERTNPSLNQAITQIKREAWKMSRAHHGSKIYPLLIDQKSMIYIFLTYVKWLTHDKRVLPEDLYYEAAEYLQNEKSRLNMNTKIIFLRTHIQSIDPQLSMQLTRYKFDDVNIALQQSIETFLETNPGASLNDKRLIQRLVQNAVNQLSQGGNRQPDVLGEAKLPSKVKSSIDSLAENILGPQYAKYLK